MKILVTGSSGRIGSALIPLLIAEGNEISRLSRPNSKFDGKFFCWSPSDGEIDESAFDGVDAVVHLAGERIDGRWTARKKKKILESRIQGTQLLSRVLADLKNKPSVLISASAVGYYGDRGDEVLGESSMGGVGFLAEVCRHWEEATLPATEAGIRVVNLRMSPVLTPVAPPLSSMLSLFTLGLGGKIGSGRQYFPWVAVDDAIRIIHHVLVTETLSGPVNVVAPDSVTNSSFTKTLGKVLGRPTVMVVPAFLVRLAAGAELADQVLLSSQRVAPKKLLESGYEYRLPELELAISTMMRK